jgi:hypothetical protein
MDVYAIFETFPWLVIFQSGYGEASLVKTNTTTTSGGD